MKFTITGGADRALFTLTGAALAFKAAPDFEAPADANKNNVYEVTVTASDGYGGTVVLALKVTVTNASGTPEFTSSAVQNVAENTTAVVTLAASDPNGDRVTFAITGGADAARFTLTGADLAFRTGAGPRGPGGRGPGQRL